MLLHGMLQAAYFLKKWLFLQQMPVTVCKVFVFCAKKVTVCGRNFQTANILSGFLNDARSRSSIFTAPRVKS